MKMSEMHGVKHLVQDVMEASNASWIVLNEVEWAIDSDDIRPETARQILESECTEKILVRKIQEYLDWIEDNRVMLATKAKEAPMKEIYQRKEEQMKEDLNDSRGKFYPNATFEEKVAKVLRYIVAPITEEQAREFVEGAESHGYEIRVYEFGFGLKKVKDGFFETEAEEDCYIDDLLDRCLTVKRPCCKGHCCDEVGHIAG